MRLLLVATLLTVGCGGKKSDSGTVPGSVLDGNGDKDPNPTTSVNTEAGATPAAAAANQPALAPADACARIAVLKGEGCGWANRFPPEFADTGICMKSLDNWFSPATEGHDMLAKTVACWSLGCDEAATCMIRVKSAATPPKPRACGEQGTSPVFVDKATWAKRRGAAVTRFAEIKTSEQEPIEVCDVQGEVEWMSRATCKGGTHPYPTQEAANDSRDSYVAHGGRCGSLLDRYTVQCPEATYTIHVDRYICPLEP